MSTDAAQSRRAVREAVRRYIRARPDAADTVIGIAQWWCPELMLEVPIHQLRLALGDLIVTNELRCTILPDGTELFSRVAGSAPEQEPTHDADKLSGGLYRGSSE
jgi:hypothetical protein